MARQHDATSDSRLEIADVMASQLASFDSTGNQTETPATSRLPQRPNIAEKATVLRIVVGLAYASGGIR